MSAAITAAAVGAAGSAYAAKQQSKAAKNAASQAQGQNTAGAQAAEQQSWEDINRVNELNRQNAIWTQQQNQAANDRNMIDSSNAWGSVSRTRDPVTGELTQTSSLTGPWADLVNQGAGQLGAMQGGLSADQFGINNDVFNAMQGLAAPQLQQQRDRENARLAAMGLATGSGQAWKTAQEALGSNENDMFNRNVLGANQAWLAGQGNLRNNMASLMGVQQGIKGLGQQDSWAQASAPQMTQMTVGQPKNATFETALRNSQLGLDAANVGMDANNNMWGTIGGLMGNKDVQSGLKNAGSAIYDWWTMPSGGGTPGASPSAGSFGPGSDAYGNSF